MPTPSVAPGVADGSGRRETSREQQMWPEIFDVIDAAAFLRVSPATVRLALATKRLPGKRVGKEWRLSQSALITWLSTPGEPKHYSPRRDVAAPPNPNSVPRKAKTKRARVAKGK